MTIAALAGAVTTGAEGAVRSTVKVFVGLGADDSIAALVATALTVCAPAARAAGWAQLQAPAALAAVVQTTVPPTLTVIVTDGSEVPL